MFDSNINTFNEREALISRLISGNAILNAPHSSVIDHYAVIAEMGLFIDERKVDILSLGLFNDNAQVRSLAAEILDRDYGFSRTSKLVVEILRNQDAKFDDIQEKVNFLVAELNQILRNVKDYHKSLDGETTDYGRRHVMTILNALSVKLRELEAGDYAETETVYIPPLTREIHREEHHGIIPRLFKALESDDIFCRRRTIRAIGELNLDFNIEKAFDIVLKVINEPTNVDDYLVTRDGINALVHLTKYDRSQLPRFIEVIRQFYTTRQYRVLDPANREKHTYYTRQDCIIALRELDLFSEIVYLIEEGTRLGIVNMMKRDAGKLASTATKVTILQTCAYFYSKNNEDTPDTWLPEQQTIITYMHHWTSSELRDIRHQTLEFFMQLPNIDQALDQTWSSAKIHHDTGKALRFELENATPDTLSQLETNYLEYLEDRKQFILALSALGIKLILSNQTIEQIVALLQEWLNDSAPANVKKEVAKEALNCRTEVAWQLYQLYAQQQSAGESVPAFDAALLDRLITTETNPALKNVLILLFARTQSDPLHYLASVIKSEQSQLLSIACEMDYFIYADKAGLEIDEDISDALLTKFHIYISRQANNFTPPFIECFLRILGKIEKPNAAKTIESVLLDDNIEISSSILLLREMTPFHCYIQRDYIQQMLQHNLPQRHKRGELLKSCFVNLYKAARYQQQNRQENQPFYPKVQLEQDLAIEINAIRRQYQLFTYLATYGATTPQPVLEVSPELAQDYHQILFSNLHRDNSQVHLYRYKQRFPRAMNFLNKDLSDAEVTAKLHASFSDSEPNQTATNAKIIGYVNNVDETGLYLDVGLRSLRPFISWDDYFSPESQPPVDLSSFVRSFAQTHLHKVKLFSIKNIVFSQDGALQELALVMAPITTSINAPVIGTVNAVLAYLTDDHNARGAIFYSDGYEISVPLSELSWRATKSWYQHDWKVEFEALIGETFELTFVEGVWSLRKNTPRAHYFYDLLANHAAGIFDLIYVGKQQQGYIVEIKPGYNTFIPPDRFLKEQALGNTLEFLLPNNDLKPSDIARVEFTQREITAEPEVVLVCKQIEQTESSNSDDSKLYTRVSGILQYRDGGFGKISSTEDRYKDFTLEIENLPPDTSLQTGDLVSGYITLYDSFNFIIRLTYAHVLPEELRVGQWYICRVASKPAQRHGRIYVRHGSFEGFIYESQMTYGHEPVINQFQMGQIVRARLSKPISWSQETSYKVRISDADFIDGLQADAATGKTWSVIDKDSTELTLAADDNTVLTVALNALRLGQQTLAVNIGDHMIFKPEGQYNFQIRVAKPVAEFALIPLAQNESDWQPAQEVFAENRPIRCIFVRQWRSTYWVLETKPGQLVIIDPQSLTEKFEQARSLTLGDYLTLKKIGSRQFELVSYEPGPLDRAANSNGQIAIRARVMSANPTALIVTLNELIAPQQTIYLRGGIFARLKLDTDHEHDQSVSYAAAGDNIMVTLAQPPQINNAISVRSSLSTGSHDVKQITLRDRLQEIKDSMERGLVEVEGKVLEYSRRDHAFRVTLNLLSAFTNYTAWLPPDRISYDTEHPYYQFRGYDNLRFVVTDLSIERRKIEVSLRDNPQHTLEELADLYQLADDTYFRNVLFVRTLTEQTQEGESTHLLIELCPGMLARVSPNAIFRDGRPYRKLHPYQSMQNGDRVDVVLSRQSDYIRLNILKLRYSSIRRLIDNKHVYQGRVENQTSESYKLKLEWSASEGVECYLDPRTSAPHETILEFDLFRFARRDENILYFAPVRVEVLQYSDTLSVTVSDVQSYRHQIEVHFASGYPGYIDQKDISNLPDFSINNFDVEIGQVFTAVVLRFNTNWKKVQFSLKRAQYQDIDYFMQPHIQDALKDSLFRAVVVNTYPDQIVVEIRPTELVRIPFSVLSTSPALQLNPSHIAQGDVLHLVLNLPDNRQKLGIQIIGLYRSILGYLKNGDLVEVYFERQDKKHFFFRLKDYPPLTARTDINPKQTQTHDKNKPIYMIVTDVPKYIDQPVRLRPTGDNDQQIRGRVVEFSAQQIIVKNEADAHITVSTDALTYRVDERLKYLQWHFSSGKRPIILTRHDKPDGTSFFSARDNHPYPPEYMRRFVGKECEVVYISTEDNEHLFEIRPGILVKIPIHLLRFQNLPITDVWRFKTGDLFIVSVDIVGQAGKMEMVLNVIHIQFSTLHRLYREFMLEADILEVSGDQDNPAVLVRYRQFETWLDMQSLLPAKSITDYQAGEKIWLRVEDLQRDEIQLQEIRRLTADEVVTALSSGKPFLSTTAAEIRREGQTIFVDAFGEEHMLPASTFSWSPLAKEADVEAVLLPDEQVFNIVAFSHHDRFRIGLRMRPEMLKKYKGITTQAQVLRINRNSENRVTSILLDLGVTRLLVTNDDIALGTPADIAPVEVGQWLSMSIHDVITGTDPLIQATMHTSRTYTKTLAVNKPFAAKIDAIHPQGLIFTYQGIFGFVSNEALCWTDAPDMVSASDFLSVGDEITVHKSQSGEDGYVFSLLHRSQSSSLLLPALTGELLKRVEGGAYVRIGSAYGFSRSQSFAHDFPDNRLLALDVQDVDVLHFTAKISVKSVSNTISMLESDIPPQVADMYYDDFFARSIVRLENELGFLETHIRSSDVSPSALWEQTCAILNAFTAPLTYRVVRSILKRLCISGSIFHRLWSELPDSVPTAAGSPLTWVIRAFALDTDQLPLGDKGYELEMFVHYALGLRPLLLDSKTPDSHFRSLHFLMQAYAKAQALDVELAILFLYNRLGNSTQTGALLTNIIQTLAGKPDLLFMIPDPVSATQKNYPKLRFRLGRTYNHFQQFKTRLDQALNATSVLTGLERLRTLYQDLKQDNILIYELNLDLAIYHVVLRQYDQANAYLYEIVQGLPEIELPLHYFEVALPAYNLALFIQYQQGKYDEMLQTSLYALKHLEHFGTWLAFLMINVKRDDVAQNILLEMTTRQHNSGRKPADGLDYRLLKTYLELGSSTQEGTNSLLKSSERFYLEEKRMWLTTSVQPRLMAAIENMPPAAIVQNAVSSGAYEYALFAYRSNPAREKWMRDPQFAKAVIHSALKLGDVKSALEYAQMFYERSEEAGDTAQSAETLIETFGSVFTWDALSKFAAAHPEHDWEQILRTVLRSDPSAEDGVLQVQMENFSRIQITNLIEGWLKAPGERLDASTRIKRIFEEIPALAQLAWEDAGIQSLIWELFDHTFNPDLVLSAQNLSASALEKVVQQLIWYELPLIAKEITERANLPTDGEVPFLETLRHQIHAYIAAKRDAV